MIIQDTWRVGPNFVGRNTSMSVGKKGEGKVGGYRARCSRTHTLSGGAEATEGERRSRTEGRATAVAARRDEAAAGEG